MRMVGLLGASRLFINISMGFALSSVSGMAGEATISSVQRACAASLTATSQTNGAYHYKVTREQRENTKRIETLQLPEVQRTWINSLFTYPLLRSVGNTRIGADNEYVTKTRESEFTFQTLSLVKTSEVDLVVELSGEVLFANRPTRFHSTAEAYFSKGDWNDLTRGRRVQITFSPAGKCALERALLGGENQLIPVACTHVLHYIHGRYGEAPPLSLEYQRDEPLPGLQGTASRLEFSGLSLNERAVIRFGEEKSEDTPPARDLH